MRKSVVIVSLGVVALGCTAFVAVPAWLQHKAIEAAASEGVTLHIGSTHLALDGIHFEDATATTVRMPSAKIHIDEITSDFSASAVVVIGAEVTIDGPPNLPNIAEVDHSVPNVGTPPIHVRSAHISWTHIFGDATADVSNISGDYDFTSHGGDTYTWTGNTAILIGGRTLGPFATDFSTDRASSYRLVLSIDAGTPNSEAWVGDFSPGRSSIDFTINGRPLSKIGAPLDLLGIPNLPADPVVNLHVIDAINRPQDGPAHGNGLLSLSVGPIPLPGLPDSAASSVDLSWSGNPDQLVPVKDGKLTVGPFFGPITGTITRPAGAIAVDLASTSNTVPCTKFAANNPLQGGAMSAIAAFAGVKSDVVGDVKIAGSVQFDSRNPGDRRMSITPTATCGLSISLGSGSK